MLNRTESAGTISVIVPVYNVEKYLPHCLSSICGQSSQDLEIILVDDGSTDGSSGICRKYAQEDPRITYIRAENGGVSAARNLGLERAKGRWIGFVDADDYLDEAFYETLVTELVRSDKEIVSCCLHAEDPDGKRVERMNGRTFPAVALDFGREEALLRYLNPDTRILYWIPCNKLFSASLIGDLRFENGRQMAEDFDFCLRCLLRSNGIRYLPQELYHYLVRPGSIITGGKFSRRTFDSMFFADKAVEELAKAEYGRDTVMRCAQIHRELTAAKILRAYYKEGKGKTPAADAGSGKGDAAAEAVEKAGAAEKGTGRVRRDAP